MHQHSPPSPRRALWRMHAGRLVRTQRITVGPHQVQHLTVGTGYTGRSEEDALLGQNFLRHFEVLMRGDVLELRPR